MDMLVAREGTLCVSHPSHNQYSPKKRKAVARIPIDVIILFECTTLDSNSLLVQSLFILHVVVY